MTNTGNNLDGTDIINEAAPVADLVVDGHNVDFAKSRFILIF